MTRKAIVLTAFNRIDYLEKSLDSWLSVRGREGWDFFVSIDDSERSLEVSLTVASYSGELNIRTIKQSPNLGVLKHPYVVIDSLFSGDYEFVLRTEDDLVVSDGILEYYDWAIEEFKNDKRVFTIHGFAEDGGIDEQVLVKSHNFNPWVFGTWFDRWETLKNHWDLDYSTNNGTPGVHSGFDWNFNTRVYPGMGLYGVFPEVSRVKNIGVIGVHGTAENHVASPNFKESNEPFTQGSLND